MIVTASRRVSERRFEMLNVVSESKSLTRGVGFALFCVVVCIVPAASSFGQEFPESQSSTSEFSASDLAAAQQLTETLGVADWLGPLAPVALSPFFGILCLSGMSLYGQGWVSADNPFLGTHSPLNNTSVFWAFLVLTLVTSIPRLTKVSKPFAQAVDQVEAWAGIITMLALKMLMGEAAPAAEELPVAQLAMVQAGILATSANVLLMVAATINIFVINTVKFFFEVLIWITPVPAIDAIFEVANKAVCAALMAIYGYSPTIATAINLAMFVAAAFVFSWVYRREVFFRTALIDAAWALVAPPRKVTKSELIVFPSSAVGLIPARSRCRLCRSENGWTLTQQRLLRSNVAMEIPNGDCQMELDAGYLTNSLKLSGSQSATLTFSRWYNACLPELAAVMGATLNAADAAAIQDRSGLKAEMG